MRACSKCSATKELDEFHRDAKGAEGRSARCKACARAVARQWNIDNKDRKAATNAAYLSVDKNLENYRSYQRKHRLQNLEQRRAADRAYAAENSAQAVHRVAEWRKKNPEKAAVTRRKDWVTRRYQRRNAMPVWADRDLIDEIYALAAKLGAETGTPHHVDHIIPIAGKNMCGLHVHTNLRAIPDTENRRKSAKEVAELIEQTIADQMKFIRENVGVTA